MKLSLIFITASLAATSAFAAEMKIPNTKVSMETCMQAVLKEKSGKVVKLEMKDERGTPMYEFEVKGEDGKVWDIECSAMSGTITEIEQDVGSADHELFRPKVKFTEAQAKETALAAYPGRINEPTDFEIEPDGKASYELDVMTDKGTEMKVEVDATSGKIVEANREFYEIGADEM